MAYENVDKSPRKPVSHQARALFRKNLSLKARQPCSICCHFVFPILLICVVGGIGLLIDTLIGSLEGTKVEPTPHVLNAPFGYCYEWFLYADPSKGDSPGTLTANGTGSGMLEKINQTDCTSFAQTSAFVPFFNLENSETAIDDFLYDVQAKLRNIPLDELTEADREELPDAAVIFNSLSYNNLSIDYTLQIPNPQASTQYFYLQSFLRINKLNGDYTGSVINLLDSALLSYMSDSKYYINTTTQAFPYFLNVDQVKNTVTNMMGMIIYPFALSLLLPSFIHAIVLEKQERLRELMKMMGMKMSLYWLLTFFFDMFLYLVVAICVLILGAIWSLNLFLQPGVLIFLMFTWGIVQVGLAFLVSTFLSRNRTITTFALYLAVILGVFIGFGLNLNYSGDDYPSYLLLYPPFAFYRGIYLLSEACTDVCMTWSSVTSSSPMATVLTFLWVEALVIYLAAFYLDVVLPQMFGIRKHPLFFIREPYNYFRKSKRQYGQQTNFDLSNLGNEDADVRAERERILSHGGSGNDPIVIKNLSKVYENGKKAVDRLTLAIKENETFGLLGPNGAGKTTTISMLTGLFPPSSGSASICGWDIVNEIDQVHLVIGICPQFDVQWPTLTVEEHLLFYARLKGTEPSKESQDVNEVAQRVGLLQHFKKKSSQLSGGMKRRLSVAMALIGNPSIVFLDEPSSGLDPTSRRNLWEVIDYYKKGRSIILTTHSMEEADTLCTRIGIIAKGRLQCLGSPVHLKNKFGKGYSLYVNFKKGEIEKGAKYLDTILGKYDIVNEVGTYRIYRIAKETVQVSFLLKEIEANKDKNGIDDWGLSQTSLEEVFLSICRDDE